MKEPNIFSTVQKYALFFGINGFLALQAMKAEIFIFPIIEYGESKIDVRLILGYSFSIISVICIFISGFDLVIRLRKYQNILGGLKDQIAKEEEKTEIKS